MSDSKTNTPGLIISTGGEYADDLPFILRHPNSRSVLSEHTSNAAAHVAAEWFGTRAEWSGSDCKPHGKTSAERRYNAREINSRIQRYANDKRNGVA